jgi:hypothetical protein
MRLCASATMMATLAGISVAETVNFDNLPTGSPPLG